MTTLSLAAAAILLVALLAYHGARAALWAGASAALLGVASWKHGPSATIVVAWIFFLAAAGAMIPGPVRRRVVTGPLLRRYTRVMPRLSPSEREALEAGTVWWDGELLRGDPDWRKLHAVPQVRLTAEEQAFLDGPVEALCEMLDEWRITRELHDLPPAAWAHLKRHGYFGMIIPRAYGGLGFSAAAHSEVIMKLTTRSATAAVTVMVPNSLGPAELLLNYGTPAQKDHYLPRLARGEEIPCFALTSPAAGSDAGAIPDYGIVCRGAWQGEAGVLGIRLNWEKRYITLGPVATLLGLAFRLYDPHGLIGPRDDVGITLALVPTDTPGVHIGRRHIAMDGAFMTGPNWGRDVFVPMSCVIGGVARAGQGWAMLMNCLAAGRSISLPANACGVAKLCALTAGAYSRVRRQFGLPIGRFEGVESVLARIAGNTYVMEAARHVTAAALDAGEKPAVVSAIVKYHLTERARAVVNDAMDIHAGRAVCTGPSNYLAHAYQQVPVAITVEGANILTRSMIIFGQGLVRGHPYLLSEVAAVSETDPERAVERFDRAVSGHFAHTVRQAARAWWLGVTSGRWAAVPGDAHTRRYYAQLTRYSSALALLSDAALVTLGGSLKRRERQSARLGDVLSLLYLGSSVLRRYEDEGRPAEDLPLLQWAMADTVCRIEAALGALLENMAPRWLARVLGALVFPRAFPEARPPDDRLEAAVARCLFEPGPARDRLTRGVFVSRSPGDAVATLEAAFRAVIVSEPVEARLRRAFPHMGDAVDDPRRAREGRAAGVITEAEAHMLARAAALRREAVMVDDFPRDLRASGAHRSSEPVISGDLTEEQGVTR